MLARRITQGNVFLMRHKLVVTGRCAVRHGNGKALTLMACQLPSPLPVGLPHAHGQQVRTPIYSGGALPAR